MEDLPACTECMADLMVPDSVLESQIKDSEGPDKPVVPNSEDVSDEEDGGAMMTLVVPDSEEEAEEEDGGAMMTLVVPDSEEEAEEEVGGGAVEVQLPDSDAWAKIRKDVRMQYIRYPGLEDFLKLILPGWESRMWDVNA
ncbi:unnamed protein product [Cuscuta epithymum]|uniref:Uncharacterized protein n=1 Tax=Cuscuta epithymum TaxID=186058 RepID=A0AAV0DN12_9ASTE|nr:unnamed protein product [Cuscuta epithymum]